MLSQDQIIRLQDIGISACHSGAAHEARKIFDGLLKLRPDNAVALIGKALSHIVVNEFPAAEEILRNQVLAQRPGDPEAETMLGLCSVLSGRREEAQAILARIERQETPCGQLARDLLAELG
ncbi:MAG: tetratricopeptide repeat protein [Desulfovibrio sp.]|jgi:predicted Zn-dependent protease|nr:tetratricopeptide repeat protein [Desulfovibrio sp.]